MAMQTKIDATAPYVLGPGEGEPMAWFTAMMLLKGSAPGLGAVEVELAPGVEPPMHMHSGEDEWFYVLDGRATFHVGDQTLTAPTGSFVALPRDVSHTFTVETPTARFLMLNAPGGFERIFELRPQSPADAVAAFDRYGVQITGPHPRDA